MNLRLRFGLLLLLGGAAIFCHGVDISHHSEELEAMITKMMECHHLPGLAVSVLQGGSVWAKGFGEAVIGNVPFSPDTKVPIGTLANIFTTVLLNIVMTDSSSRFRHIRWYSPVKQVLSGVNFFDPFLNEKLTLEDLAAGRTGLSPLPLLWKAEALPDTLTRSDLARHFHKIPKGHAFREYFESNHLAHGLLGRITEVLGNGTWKQLMQDKLLSRLQMNATGFLGDPQTSITAARGFALPYTYCPRCPSYYRTRFTTETRLSKYRLPVVYPGNGMVSSAKDMTAFLKEVLKNGKPVWPLLFPSDIFTRRKTIVLRSHPWVVNFKKPKYPASYKTSNHGMGWFLGQYNGYNVAWNVGKLHNYLTFVAVVKDLDLAMTFVTNSAGGRTFSTLLMSYIVDLAAGEPRWLKKSSVCSFLVSRVASDRVYGWAPDPFTDIIDNAAEIAGTYRDPLFGEVTVTRSGQTLNATYGRLTGKIWKSSRLAHMKFSPTGSKKELIFKFDENSNGQRMLYISDSPAYDGYLAFLKTANDSNEK